MDKLSDEIYQYQQKLSEFVLSLEKINSFCENSAKERSRIANTNQQLNQKINESEKLKNLMSGKLAEYQKRLNFVKSDLRECEKSLELKNKAADEINKKITASEVNLESRKDSIIDLMNMISSKKNELNSLNVLKNNIEKQRRKLVDEITALNDSLNATEKLLDNNLLNDIKSEIDSMLANLGKLKSQKEEAEREVMHLAAKEQDVLKSINEARAQLNVLIEMEKGYEGMQKGIKDIVKTIYSIPALKSGYCGIVARLLRTPKNLEVAIETALGGAVQYIVTEDDMTAQEIINLIKRRRLGRATFLPINTIKARNIDKNSLNLIRNLDVIGVASEKIVYDKKYDNIFKNLLGQVLITQSLKSAVEVAKAVGFRYKIVTLDGELVNPGGSLTGGSKVKTNFILSRARQIDELKTKISSFEYKLTEIKNSIRDYQKNVLRFETQINELSEKVKHKEIEFASRKRNVEELQIKLSQLSSKKQLLLKEKAQLKQEEKEINDRDLLILKEIDCLEQKLANLKTEVDKHQSSFKNEKQKMDVLLSAVTDLRVRIAALQQEESGINQNLEYVTDRLQEIKLEQDQATEALNQNNIMLQNLCSEIQEKTLHKSQVEEEIKRAEEQIILKQTQKSILKADLDRLNEVQIQHSTVVQKLQGRIHQAEIRQTRFQLEIQGIESKLWETYKISRQQLKGYPCTISNNKEIKEAIEKIQILKTAIDDLGLVNPGAIEEFANKKKRYNFLQVQIKDLENAQESLNKVINKMLVKMKEQFKNKFEILANNFNEVFREMFNGGKATIFLGDPESPLDSNIEIMAQPPGKKLQNLLMLSGGERALTAIALLFAIIKDKPTPFCVLDEIEAALDDVNVDRFAKYLQRYSEETQFIIITHRKGTMEVAKTLYGVTMEDTATSKMVSVKLKDATA
jgi:chromosome segregation protein